MMSAFKFNLSHLRAATDVGTFWGDDLSYFYRGILSVASGKSGLTSDERAVGFSAGGHVVLRTEFNSPRRFCRKYGLASSQIVDGGLLWAPGSGGAYHLGGETLDAPPGSIILFDLTQAFEFGADIKGASNEEFLLWAPRSQLERVMGSQTDWHGGAVSASSGPAVMAHRGLSWIFEDKPEAINELDPLSLMGALKSVILLFGAGGLFPIHSSGPAQNVTAKARKFISTYLFSRDLSPEMIAGNIGVSRAGLYRAFEPLGGVSTYIRRTRLRRIHDDLLKPELNRLPPAEIARRWGIRSRSTFDRAFQEAFGVSAQQVREGAHGETYSPPETSDGGSPQLIDLLKIR